MTDANADIEALQKVINDSGLLAKSNGHDPHTWLLDVLTRLPTTRNSRLGDLLPHRWSKAASG